MVTITKDQVEGLGFIPKPDMSNGKDYNGLGNRYSFTHIKNEAEYTLEVDFESGTSHFEREGLQVPLWRGLYVDSIEDLEHLLSKSVFYSPRRTELSS